MIANISRLLIFFVKVELHCPCSLLSAPKHTTKQHKPFLFFPSRPAAAVRVSPCHSRQPSVLSDASAVEGDRSSTPSDINSPRHRTHSLCNVRAAPHCTFPSNHLPCSNRSLSTSPRRCSGCIHVHPTQPVSYSLCSCKLSVVKFVHDWQHVECHFSVLPTLLPTLHLFTDLHLTDPSLIPSFISFFLQSLEDLEEAKRKKKKEKMGLGSLSRVFARGKQRKSLDPGLFDGTSTPEYYIEEDADW